MMLEEATMLALQRYRIEGSPSSLHGWRSVSRSLLRHLNPRTPIDQLDAATLQRFVRGRLDAGSAPESVRRVLAFVREAIRQAGRELDPEEWRTVSGQIPPLRRRVRVLSSPELERVRGAISPKRWALVSLTLLTGLRRVELFAMQLKHFEPVLGVSRDTSFPLPLPGDDSWLPLGLLKVPSVSNRPKRTVPLGPEAARIVNALAFLAEGRWLVGGRHADRAGLAGDYTERFGRVCRELGIEDVSWRDLRTTAAARARSAGAPLESIVRLMGHGRSNLPPDLPGSPAPSMWARGAWPAALALDPSHPFWTGKETLKCR